MTVKDLQERINRLVEVGLISEDSEIGFTMFNNGCYIALENNDVIDRIAIFEENNTLQFAIYGKGE